MTVLVMQLDETTTNLELFVSMKYANVGAGFGIYRP